MFSLSRVLVESGFYNLGGKYYIQQYQSHQTIVGLQVPKHKEEWHEGG